VFHICSDKGAGWLSGMLSDILLSCDLDHVYGFLQLATALSSAIQGGERDMRRKNYSLA
jgi:hypothetical protein